MLVLDHGAPQWSRIRSVLILLSFAVLIGFYADLITNIVTCAIFRSWCSPVVKNKKCSDFTEFCCPDSILC